MTSVTSTSRCTARRCSRCSSFPPGIGEAIRSPPCSARISMHSGISFQAIESPIRPRSKAIRALSDPDLSTIGKQAAADLDEQHWAQESFKLSTSAVYNSEVTGHLRALAESGQSPQDVPLQLTEEYLKAGGAVSERRLVEAGFRLGAVLKQVAAGTQVKSSGPVASASPENPGTGGDSKEITVYITKSGQSYHADGCRYLSKSKIPISLSEAKEKYTPCPICHPPE